MMLWLAVLFSSIWRAHSACLDAPVPVDEDTSILLAYRQADPTSALLAYAARDLLVERLGVRAQALPVAVPLAALADNTADALLDYWPSAEPLPSALVDGGALGVVRTSAWYATATLVDVKPELASYRGWREPANWPLVAGEFVIPNSAWSTRDAQILQELNITLNIISFDAPNVYEQLVRALNERSGTLFHDREPSPLEFYADVPPVARVALPDDRAYQPEYAKKLWLATLPPNVQEFLRAIDVTTEDVKSMLEARVAGMSEEAAACEFLSRKDWSAWIPAPVQPTTTPMRVVTTAESGSAEGGLELWHYLLIIGGGFLFLLSICGIVAFLLAKKALRADGGDDDELVDMEDREQVSSSREVANNAGWRINYDELDLSSKIGSGGFGAVYRGQWRGTDVAVKKLFKSDLNEEFAQEVSLMCKLRHPNVILFMGACVDEPNLCIVMEFMPKGSLFEVLQNDDITLGWDSKMRFAVDVARGMTYLHEAEQTILHGDLKSLNILVDNSMGAKVSDFGLTRFKSSDGTNNVGSLFWAAPEVIRGEGYTEKSDVYSFGIVLYEIIARKQPYIDLDIDPLAVASAVVLGHARPTVPTWCPQPVHELMSSCWAQDLDERPPFRDILERLQTVAGDQMLAVAAMEEHGIDGSLGQLSSIPPPDAHSNVAVVTCDVATEEDVWTTAPTAMRDALVLHNKTLRTLLVRHGGYEVRGQSDGTVVTAVFGDLDRAAEFCLQAQLDLLEANWPNAVLKLPDCAEVLDASTPTKKKKKKKKTVPLFRGPRARQSIHLGVPETLRDELTGRTDFIGQVVEHTHKIRQHAHGGQVVISKAVFEKLEPNLGSLGSEKRDPVCRKLSKAQSRGVSSGEELRYLLPKALSARPFKPGKAPPFLSPGYIILADDVEYDQTVDSLGLGSYGEVYAGDYADTAVAIKKLFQQRPKEALLLDFRAELARISTLAHENLAPFVGGCPVPQRLMIVHEFVPISLAELINDDEQEFAWINKLKITLGIADALSYLHSLRPDQILHRNLKLANVLLEDDFTPRLVDFGFDKIKAINHTMSKSALPGWAPPEVLDGLPYSEKSDVFNCGMLFFQIVTRDTELFSNVSLRDVLSGASTTDLHIPEDTPEEFVALLKKCWHNKVDKRPTAKTIAKSLRKMRDALDESSSDDSDSS